MIHQEATNTELSTTMGGYAGGMCRGAMGAAVTNFSDTGPPTTSGQLMFTILPVDFAFSADGKQVAVVAAGSTTTFGGPGSSVTLMDASALADDNGGCIFPSPPAPPPGQDPVDFRPPIGAPTAVAFDGLGRVVAQTREPARLEILSNHGGTILLDETSRVDTGHSIFHSATAFGLACASCHPEGGDDGRVWRFQNLGLRRTQSLRGGILATAPFHWDGQLTDLGQLMGEVFTKRMGGPTLTDEQVKVLGSWLDRIPLLPASAPADPAAVGRGKLLFQDPKVGCTTCHNGPALTNNMTVDVGTGQALQVPSLRGVGARAPYMHDGCAKTLLDRFTPSCGGGDRHGVTSQLSGAQLADLVAYLETL
jgi:mono/diheme cytochrome c family protein